MDEIADLIRLLAEAPAEEAPMSRPKELLDRLAIERAVQEGVVQPGAAVPDADPKYQSQMVGTTASPTVPSATGGVPSKINLRQPTIGSSASPIAGMPTAGQAASPSPTQTQIGATANPKTGIPDVPVEVQIQSPAQFAGRPAPVRSVEAVAGMPAQPTVGQAESQSPAAVRPGSAQTGPAASPTQPLTETQRAAEAKRAEVMSAPTARVMSPETFMSRVATPKILDAIAGMPAATRQRETVMAVASPNPRSQVTISVPPAFPIDPKEAFSMVDEQMELPPRQEPIERRNIVVDTTDLKLESTEAYVSRMFHSTEGARSDLDRFVL